MIFADEGTIDGVQYVTVLNDTFDPIEYNVPADRAASMYGFVTETLRASVTATYGWIITKDHLFEADPPSEDVISPAPTSDVGTMGPSDIPDEIAERLRAGEGAKFRIYDDDGELYYSGRFIGDSEDDHDFGPLWDFGAPNAGATSIRYLVNGKWTEL